MEKESFEDAEVAELLNESFIAIKVDREERPDIDHIYMDVCQALTGHGGWPLTILMTPEQKPFFAGTYYPKTDRMGMQGLLSILSVVRDAWQTKRDALLDSSEKIMNHIGRERASSGEDIPEEIFDRTFDLYEKHFDTVFGGFGQAPKFPTSHNLMFLLRYWKRTNNPKALLMVEKTLDSMYRGGIYDHIGFGFCRYSTDKKWLVPHFEKMLYDNALLAITYLEAYQATQKKKYASIAENILTYVLRDMTSSEGGFYSAEDADSEGVEGKFYLWSIDEVLEVLGEAEGRTLALYYDITSKGNFEGKSIPNLINNSLPFDDINKIKAFRDKLFDNREKRVHPHKDDKILTSWNGLMIAAMAIAGRLLKKDHFIRTAQKSVSFIFEKLIRDDGRLLARYRDGQSNYPAYAEDYAFLTLGLIELYETTYEAKYLEMALMLSDELISLFWDDEQGGLFVYGKDSETLITRPKEIYDGAAPSSNSVTALNFLRLSRITGRHEFEDKAEKILRAFSDDIRSYPIGYSFALMALIFARSKGQEVVLVSDTIDEAKQFIDKIYDIFRPFTISLLYKPNDEKLKELVPYVESYSTVKGKASAYICENYTCQAPVTENESFEKMLN